MCCVSDTTYAYTHIQLYLDIYTCTWWYALVTYIFTLRNWRIHQYQPRPSMPNHQLAIIQHELNVNRSTTRLHIDMIMKHISLNTCVCIYIYDMIICMCTHKCIHVSACSHIMHGHKGAARQVALPRLRPQSLGWDLKWSTAGATHWPILIHFAGRKEWVDLYLTSLSRCLVVGLCCFLCSRLFATLWWYVYKRAVFGQASRLVEPATAISSIGNYSHWRTQSQHWTRWGKSWLINGSPYLE